MAMEFKMGFALSTSGEMVAALGFEHDDMFIVNARISSCGRFHAVPSKYGVSEADATKLAALNAGRDLMAYWEI